MNTEYKSTINELNILNGLRIESSNWRKKKPDNVKNNNFHLGCCFYKETSPKDYTCCSPCYYEQRISEPLRYTTYSPCFCEEGSIDPTTGRNVSKKCLSPFSYNNGTDLNCCSLCGLLTCGGYKDKSFIQFLWTCEIHGKPLKNDDPRSVCEPKNNVGADVKLYCFPLCINTTQKYIRRRDEKTHTEEFYSLLGCCSVETKLAWCDFPNCEYEKCNWCYIPPTCWMYQKDNTVHLCIICYWYSQEKLLLPIPDNKDKDEHWNKYVLDNEMLLKEGIKDTCCSQIVTYTESSGGPIRSPDWELLASQYVAPDKQVIE